MKSVTDAVRELGGVWPKNCGTYHSVEGYFVGSVTDMLRFDDQTKAICTRTEFDAEVERLRNKPSWDQARPGYTWRWQNDDGVWMFGKGDEPRREDGYFVTGLYEPAMFHGEVIGDWRDTLEHRPVEISKEGVERIMKAFDEMDQWDIEAEWGGEGFPPVGTACEAYILSETKNQGRPMDKWVRGTSKGKARAGNGGWGCLVEDGQGVIHFVRLETYLRPLKSDRYRWVETAQQRATFARSDDLGAIYDAMQSGTLPIPTPKGESA